MGAGDLEDIADDQGQVIQIARLAVAQPESGENAQHLDMPLQAHQIEPGPPLAPFARGHADGITITRQIAIQCGLVEPVIAIAQQRHQVVGDRTAHGILKIQHPQIATAVEQQIAAVIVAVNHYLWLLGGTVDQ